MSGYCGYSKSNRAIEAESNYKFPRTVMCRLLGLKPEALSDLVDPCEWHHTSKKYNSTDYYDCRDCIRSRILRNLTKPRPNKKQLSLRNEIRNTIIKEVKDQRRVNASNRKEKNLRAGECQILLQSEYRSLYIAGTRAGKKCTNSTAAHLAFELTFHGSKLKEEMPYYKLTYYEQKCPNLLSLCLKAADYLKRCNYGNLIH